MPSKFASRLLLAAAVLVTAGTAAAVTGVTGATAGTTSLPRLEAPGLHAAAAAAAQPAAAPTAAASSCDYHAVIPADRFKGIPVFNATQAAQPFLVRFFTTQGVI